MPIALLTGPDDPAETRRAINELIIEINAGGGGGGGGSPALLVESGAESTISALSAGTAPDGTEEGVFVQGGVDVKLSTAQLLTSASAAAMSGLNGTNMYIQAGDGDGVTAYGGQISARGGYGYYQGGNTQLRGGDGYTYSGRAEITGGSGSYYGGDATVIGGAGGTYGGHVRVMGGVGGTKASVYIGAGNGDLIFSYYKTSPPSAIGALWVDVLTGIVHCVHS